MIIALTGGIGAGKSLVAQYFAELGAKVISADDLARKAIERGSAGFDQVVARFGDEILKDGEIDRRRLGEIIFADNSARKDLEAIIHPKVQLQLAEYKKSMDESEILIYEIPLLVETNAAAKFDQVITVEAPIELRRERLIKRGLYPSEIEKRISNQATSEARRSVANIVIENDGQSDQLFDKVEKIWNELNASRN